MLRGNTKVLDGRTVELFISGAQLGGVIIANNSPHFLYLGRDATPTRESALYVIEPYTDVQLPCSDTRLFLLDGPRIGGLPQNSQVSYWYTTDPLPLQWRRYSRNAVVWVMNQVQVQADTSTSGGIQAQGMDGSSSSSSSSGQQVQAPFVVPSSANRRTVNGTISGANFSSVYLLGSPDGARAYVPLAKLAVGGTSFSYDLMSKALPPYLQVQVTPDGAGVVDVYMVVDL